MQETTAIGAPWLAGMKAGIYPGREGFGQARQLDRRFEPKFDPARRERLRSGWQDAASRTPTRR